MILEPTVFDQLPEATDEENDMLDLAFGLTETYAPDILLFLSRLIACFSVSYFILCTIDSFPDPLIFTGRDWAARSS